ncbi:MAG: succinate dehydrogenase, hydrophobic membrane anchor protein [Hyphomicrobiales bacterium]|nr:succinate dehydrogenase, hydrophobic membrane anchor protein [Hyphomicrobiales bacterium]
MSTPLRPTPSPTHARIRSPLAKVRGLGSAKEGADHFWKQRVTAVANIFLITFAVLMLVKLAGADYATVKKTMQKPLVAILFLLLVLSGVHHMRLGMQVIIEDYVRGDGARVVLLMLNSFFAISVGLACIFSVLKLAFAA